MEKLIQSTREHSGEYGAIPFWSWNDRLEEEGLRRQLRNMREINMGGAFMHARTGLDTEYFSDEWFDAVRTSVDEAGKLGMTAWCYDENGWPSGFGGGELLKDPANWATFLTVETSERYPDAPSGKPMLHMGQTGSGDPIVGVYMLRDGKCVRVNGDEGKGSYYVVRQGYDPSYVDTLDAKIVRKFIDHTYETYRERVGISETMPGFFTDEPQYYRWGTTWSNTLPDEYRRRYGEDIFDGLAALFLDFDGAEQFRYRYYKMLHELFITAFPKQLGEWCEKNGAKLTGHAIEEFSLEGQMLCCGGVMPFYEYEQLPGIDYLGRNLVNDLGPRQLGSVCAQLGKRMALSEMFACCGWDVSPNELKNIAELQYAGGVNLMCWHLYPYSIRGQRKRDYPANYSEHLPWQKALGEFNEYFRNLGYILAQGNELAETLVIHPNHSAWMWYKRSGSGKRFEHLERSLSGLIELLGEYQVPYHLGDEWMMARHASVSGDRLRVGLCEYSQVVVPVCDTLDSSTAALLREFIANGGRVWLYGPAPACIDGAPADNGWLRSTCGFDDIKASCPVAVRASASPQAPLPDIKMMLRRTGEGRIVYLTSLSHSAIDGVFVRLDGFRGVSELDLLTLEARPVYGERCGDSLRLRLDFADSQSHLLIETDEQPSSVLQPRARAIRLGDFELAEKPVNALTLDRARVSLNGGGFSEERPIERIRDELLQERFEGDVSLQFSFDAGFLPKTLRVCAEPLKYKSVSVNGHALDLGAPWWLDRSFLTADIAPLVREGHNELIFTFGYHQREYVYEVLYGGGSESLRNCLSFDTEVEAVYLYGDFAVASLPLVPDVRNSLCCEGGFRLVPQKNTVDLRDITSDGYPFFAGTITAKTTVSYRRGGATLLDLPGRYAVCEVFVNGVHAGRLMFARSIDLADYLTEGDNELVLRLTNSNRNLLGPHHCVDPEPYGVGPNTFSFESQWRHGRCSRFRERYAFVRFGIDC